MRQTQLKITEKTQLKMTREQYLATRRKQRTSYQQRHKALGLCRDCFRVAVAGKSRCVYHQQKQREYCNKWRHQPSSNHIQNSDIKFSGGRKMDNETIRELISLRQKGFLTEEELHRKLLQQQDLEVEQVRQVFEQIAVKKGKHPSKPSWHRRWTPEEEKRLMEQRNLGKSFSEIAKVLGRNRRGVEHRIYELLRGKASKPSVSKPMFPSSCFRNTWADTEIDYLKKFYGKINTKDISASLGRTEASIKVQASQLGLTNRNKKEEVPALTNKFVQGRVQGIWKMEEDDYIRKFYATIKTKDIAKSLNRTPAAVRCRAKGLKVRKHPKADKNLVQVGYNQYPKTFSVGP